MAVVVVAEARDRPFSAALDEIFAATGGVRALVRPGRGAVGRWRGRVRGGGGFNVVAAGGDDEQGDARQILKIHNQCRCF